MAHIYAEDTYRAIRRCSTLPQQQEESSHAQTGQSFDMDEIESANLQDEEDDGEYEAPVPQPEEISDESEVEYWSKLSPSDNPIVIDDDSYHGNIKMENDKVELLKKEEGLKKEESPDQPSTRIKRETIVPLECDDSDSEPVSRGRRRSLRVLAPRDDSDHGDSDSEDTSTDEDSVEVKHLLDRPRLTRSTRRESDHIFLL